MTDLEQVRRTWLAERPEYERLGNELAVAMEQDIRQVGIWADVTSRAKEVDSLIRKLIGKPNHSYESIGDKAGVRIVVRYKDEIDRILALAERAFDVSGVENTVERLGPEVMGYRSVHASVRYHEHHERAQQFPPERYSAELQVRTLAQHLWAEMAHDAVYKNEDTLQPMPNPLKRRVYILAGVVELADEEFSRIEREIPVVPELRILKGLERQYYKLTTRRGDSEMSLRVIRLLAPLYDTDAGEIVAHFEDFYVRHEGVLQHVYEVAETIVNRSAFLFQPEALMLYDLLETDSLAVRRIWNEQLPEKELERVANAFGISFD